MKTFKPVIYKILSIFLAIILLFPSSVLAQDSALDEVRYYLRNYYVDPVNEQVLDAPTIDDILSQLNDPYTNFMTAQQYQDFNDSLEQSFSGIGMYMDMVTEGVKVSGLVSNSPAEQAGLQVGDIITSADSHSLKGLVSDEVVSLIRGPEGSKVLLSIQRAGQSFSVEVERKTITIPSITSEIMPFNSAYINISTFGSETSQLFADSLANLRSRKPDSYIIDLRENGGGYVESALDIAGYFIGDNVAMQTKYRKNSAYEKRAVKQDYVVNQPTIFLIDNGSASASELLTGAVRDYGKALLIGTRSFGKGSMQELIPLDSGDYFKMTIAHFLTPLGHEINKIGIAPDLLIEKADPLKAAELLLSSRDTDQDKTGLVKLSLASQSFVIDTNEARETEYWQAYGEILDRVGTKMVQGNGPGWASITPQELKDRWPLYYPEYQFAGQLPNISVDKKFILTFPQDIDWKTFTQENIELINSSTGERISSTLQKLSNTELQIIPQQKLQRGTSYWVLLHAGIQYADHSSLSSGLIFTASVER